MPIRKLVNHDGTLRVSLDKGDLQYDGLVNEDGEVVGEQEMYVSRVSEGAYLIRAIDDGDVPEVDQDELAEA